jgi:XRE family aerobic/anaerobic benzoate catabolism transcriptional regulator
MPDDAATGDDLYLRRLGERVREERARRGMSRRILARDSRLSERYLAQLESGKGNLSINLLRRVAGALNQPLAALVAEPCEADGVMPVLDRLHRLSAEELASVPALLDAHFGAAHQGSADRDGRLRRLALIGLRGAGKSTLGGRLAGHLGVPFIELDAEIERQSGLSLSEIFTLYGQAAYRRAERKALDDVLDRVPHFVLATGGSIVAEPQTYDRLLRQCFTVWLKASPREHMARVVAQGDLRPMADNSEAMADLRRILAVRGPLYARADRAVDTAGTGEEESFEALIGVLPPGVPLRPVREAAG